MLAAAKQWILFKILKNILLNNLFQNLEGDIYMHLGIYIYILACAYNYLVSLLLNIAAPFVLLQLPGKTLEYNCNFEL